VSQASARVAPSILGDHGIVTEFVAADVCEIAVVHPVRGGSALLSRSNLVRVSGPRLAGPRSRPSPGVQLTVEPSEEATPRGGRLQEAVLVAAAAEVLGSDGATVGEATRSAPLDLRVDMKMRQTRASFRPAGGT
jgi:hypothetical protein